MLPKRMFITGLFACGLLLSGADYSKERNDVQSGKTSEAKAVWWGYNKKDATKCLQAALNSGARKIFVDKMDGDWIITPVDIPSNVEVIFAKGVVVRAKKNAYHGKYDRVFNIVKRKNVVLRGRGGVEFIMDKEAYLGKDYERSNQRHCINIQDSDAVTVSDITIRLAGGDGVYVGPFGARNIRLENVVCDSCQRQGVSLTGVDNFYAKNCKFNNTKGLPPECGVDLEPNPQNGGISNVTFEDCEFRNNAFYNVIVSMGCLSHKDAPPSVTFRNCLIDGKKGIRIESTGQDQQKAGFVQFLNCRINGMVQITGHRNSQCRLVFRNCQINNKNNDDSAIVITANQPEDLRLCEFTDITVADDHANREPIRFISYGNALIDPVVDHIVTINSRGEKRVFDTEAFRKSSAPNPEFKLFHPAKIDTQKLIPAAENGQSAGQEIRYRGKTEFFVFAKKGETVPLRFTHHVINQETYSKYFTDPAEVRIFDPSGILTEKSNISYRGKRDFHLNAKQSGAYRLEIDARTQATLISRTDGKGGYGVGAREKLYLITCKGELFFAVPPGVKDIHIETNSPLGEASSVELVDPNGKIQDSTGGCFPGCRILKAKHIDISKGEVWSIRFNASKLWLRIGAPLPGIFSTSPVNLLVPVAQKEFFKTGKISQEIIPNGNFKNIEDTPVRKKGLRSDSFAEGWNGTGVVLQKITDHNYSIKIKQGLLYRLLDIPATGGNVSGVIMAQGRGKLKIRFSGCIRKKGDKRPFSHEIKEDIAEVELTPEMKEHHFTWTIMPFSKGYIFIHAGNAVIENISGKIESEKKP